MAARLPAYRRRLVRGKPRAYVTLPDADTGRRKDFWLGEYDTPASRRKYAKLIAAWEERGRRLPDSAQAQPVETEGPTVAELAIAYQRASAIAGREEASNRRTALRVAVEVHGDTPAAAFGPVALREVREAMVRGNPDRDPPRPPWTRTSCNRQAKRIAAMFRWAASYELLPASVYEALRTLEPLRAGRTDAVDPDPIAPAPQASIDAVLAIASRQIAAMIRLQLATGMRPGEVCTMRPCDIDSSGPVWRYTPRAHKTAHRGKRRVVALGPAAQAAIRELLEGRAPAAYLFSPAEAEAARRAELHANRKTPLKYGNRPGTNRVDDPLRAPGDQYTRDSYRRAIDRLLDQAEQLARERAVAAGHKVPPGVRLVQRWHPHQLRHNAATEIRKRFGLEAARLMLGHSSALITDAVYAERDEAALLKIAAAIA